VLEDALRYEPDTQQRVSPPPLVCDAERHAVFAALGPQPCAVDDITRATRIPVRDVRIILMELDLAGRIERHGNNMVSLQPDEAHGTLADQHGASSGSPQV
jgi:predicted Rossmann fold nucleotide-binding protein DprA/Smf involved in DNA uptake